MRRVFILFRYSIGLPTEKREWRWVYTGVINGMEGWMENVDFSLIFDNTGEWRVGSTNLSYLYQAADVADGKLDI